MFRQASPEELRYSGESLSLRDDFKDVLANGHTIHGYSSGGSVRIVCILADREYSDDAPLLGYGDGENVEVALRRARDSYRGRVAAGDEVLVGSGQWSSKLMTGGPVGSLLDKITWGGEFAIFQDGEEAVITTPYRRSGRHMPLEARGADAQAALDELAAAYEAQP